MFLFSPTNSLASFMTSVNQCCGVLLFLVPGSSTLKILCPIYPTFPLPPPYSLLSVSDCTFYIQFSPPVCTFLHSYTLPSTLSQNPQHLAFCISLLNTKSTKHLNSVPFTSMSTEAHYDHHSLHLRPLSTTSSDLLHNSNFSSDIQPVGQV